MAKRLQVVLRVRECREIQRAARTRHMSIAEWVRPVLAAAGRRERLGDAASKKLDIVRDAARHEFPTAEIDEMVA